MLRRMMVAVVASLCLMACSEPGTVAPAPDQLVRPPSGMRWVGFGEVALAVPTALQSGARSCWTRRVARDLQVTTTCLELRAPRGEQGSLRGITVMVGPLDQRPYLRDMPMDSVPNEHGLEVRVGPACPPDAFCVFDYGRTITVPSANLAVTAIGQHEHQALIDQIARSIQPVPTGYVTVPPVPTGVSMEIARSLLSDIGLSVDAPAPSPAYYVWGTIPAAGEVVEMGATVRVTVGDG